MSPTQFDTDRAIEALRSEVPDQDVTERARQYIHSRPPEKRPGMARGRRIVLGATAAACALLLWPRAGSGVTWAQAVQSTFDSPNMIETSYLPNGKVAMIAWRSGVKRATLLYSKNGALIAENRSDGKHSVNFFSMFLGSPTLVAPNAHNFAVVSDDASRVRSQFELPLQSIDALLRKPGVVVLDHKPSPHNQNVEQYRVQLPKPRSGDLFVDVDTATHRIQSISDRPRSGQMFITYPESIPDSIFQPRIQAAQGVETYDYLGQKAEVRRHITQGLGTKGPVTLRLVLLDFEGNLWAFWTGSPPNPYLHPPIRLPGVAIQAPQSFKEFTTAHDKAAGAQPAPSIHQWLGGMAVTPKSKLGETIDIDVPYKGGVAHFHKVPILRIGLLRYFKEELGAGHL